MVAALNGGLSPAAVWDALFAASVELVFRQPGIIALHAVTTTNAIHQAYQLATAPETRALLLLQNASFLPLFRRSMAGRGPVAERRITTLMEAELPPITSVEDVFVGLRSDPERAVLRALSYLRHGDARSLIDAARRLVFLKANDPHDYKYSSAVLEDYYALKEPWASLFLAASVVKMCSADEPTSPLVERVRSVLG